MHALFFRLAGGRFTTALLKNRGRSRTLLSRRIERGLKRKLGAVLNGTASPRLGQETSRFPVSLTSWRPRLASLPLTLLTLVEQTRRPAAIMVWLTPADTGLVPLAAREVFESLGVQFSIADDLGPHKKWLPLLESGATQPFLICDDDTIYPRNWLASLVAEDRPDSYVGCRCHRILRSTNGELSRYAHWIKEIEWDGRPSHSVCVTGCGGALIYPDRIPAAFRDRQALLRNCPRADDIWLKLAHLQAGIPCFKTRYSFPCLDLPGMVESGLAAMNVNGAGNDQQLAASLAYSNMKISTFFRDSSLETATQPRP